LQPRALVSWSSGKDCCFALTRVREAGVEIAGLLTNVDERTHAVAHHGVPHELVAAQAEALGVPLRTLTVPAAGASLSAYEQAMTETLDHAVREGVSMVVFGDLFLAELRAHREAKLAPTGLEARFPLWLQPTRRLAFEMLERGIAATVVSVDRRVLPGNLVGRRWDAELLASLPDTVDPCGENGEFHTFVHDGPDFDAPIPFEIAGVTERGDFAHAVFARTTSPGGRAFGGPR
jgi:uncharacterized protein (TIGR00290 family)